MCRFLVKSCIKERDIMIRNLRNEFLINDKVRHVIWYK